MSVVEVQHAFRTALCGPDALDRVETLLEADGRWAVMARRSDHIVATRPRPTGWSRALRQTPDASVTLWVADDETATGAVIRVAAVLDTSPRNHGRELNRLASYFEGFGLRFNG